MLQQKLAKGEPFVVRLVVDIHYDTDGHCFSLHEQDKVLMTLNHLLTSDDVMDMLSNSSGWCISHTTLGIDNYYSTTAYKE